MRIINEELIIIILLEIKNNSKVTEVAIANKCGYTERTVRRYFKLLKDRKKIELAGVGKKRCWKIIE